MLACWCPPRAATLRREVLLIAPVKLGRPTKLMDSVFVVLTSKQIRGIGGALCFAALGLAYLLLAKLGLAVASLHPSASPIWPPSGLALASCLLWGNRVWPAIASGAFLANAITFGSITTSMAIAMGNTLEGVVTASLVARWCTRDKPFATP